jgi:hypothetical protein
MYEFSITEEHVRTSMTNMMFSEIYSSYNGIGVMVYLLCCDVVFKVKTALFTLLVILHITVTLA